MRVIARAPIDATLAGRDYRPGDAFDIDDAAGQALVDAGAVERIDRPKKRGE